MLAHIFTGEPFKSVSYYFFFETLSHVVNECSPFSEHQQIEMQYHCLLNLTRLELFLIPYGYHCMNFGDQDKQSCRVSAKNLNSQLTRCKLTWKFTANSFWSHSSTSHRTHKMISQLWPSCKSSVSLHLTPWACCDLFVRSTDALIMQWLQCDHCDVTGNLTVRHSGESTLSMVLAHTFTG